MPSFKYQLSGAPCLQNCEQLINPIVKDVLAIHEVVLVSKMGQVLKINEKIPVDEDTYVVFLKDKAIVKLWYKDEDDYAYLIDFVAVNEIPETLSEVNFSEEVEQFLAEAFRRNQLNVDGFALPLTFFNNHCNILIFRIGKITHFITEDMLDDPVYFTHTSCDISYSAEGVPVFFV